MAHEDLHRTETVEGSSDRAFGLVFASVFLLIAAWPLVSGLAPRWWAGGLAAAFALIAWLRPASLARLNRLWIGLGLVLGKVVSPIALGIVYFGIVTPIGLVMRLAGKDPLRLRREPGAGTYWMPRHPPGPPPNSMTNQF
jgi:hypothetical protein